MIRRLPYEERRSQSESECGRTEEQKEEPAKQEAEKAKKPTAEELQQQVIFLTKQAAEAQKKAREAEDKAKSEEIKLQTALSQYVRLQADFDNFRRRTKDSEAKAADTYKAETLKSFCRCWTILNWPSPI